MEIVDMGITKFWIYGRKSRSVNNFSQWLIGQRVEGGGAWEIGVRGVRQWGSWGYCNVVINKRSQKTNKFVPNNSPKVQNSTAAKTYLHFSMFDPKIQNLVIPISTISIYQNRSISIFSNVGAGGGVGVIK
jgi:hypothetical protein